MLHSGIIRTFKPVRRAVHVENPARFVNSSSESFFFQVLTFQKQCSTSNLGEKFFLEDVHFLSIHSHKTDKFIGYETIGSVSWITDLVIIPVKVSGRSFARFVRPVSCIVQAVPMVIAISRNIWITYKKITILLLFFIHLFIEKKCTK